MYSASSHERASAWMLFKSLYSIEINEKLNKLTQLRAKSARTRVHNRVLKVIQCSSDESFKLKQF